MFWKYPIAWFSLAFGVEILGICDKRNTGYQSCAGKADRSHKSNRAEY